MLEWDYEDGSWESWSAIVGDDIPLVWHIGVSLDGLFRVDGSSSELTQWEDTFPSLADAKAFCEAREAELTKSCEEEQKPDQDAEPIVQNIFARWQEGSEWESHPNLVQLDRLRGIHLTFPVRAGVMTRFECQMADDDVVTITGKPLLIIVDAAGQISITFQNPTFVAVDG